MALGKLLRMLAGIPANKPFWWLSMAENVNLSISYAKIEILDYSDIELGMEEHRNPGE